MFVVRTCRSGDVPSVLRLLRDAGMRTDGVDKHPERFWVLEELGEFPRIAGTIGMEVHGRMGLLRSFVIERGNWHFWAIVELLLLVLSAARKQGIDEMYLAAAGSPYFFEALGFSTVDESELPDPIRASEHLRKVANSGEVKVMRCFLSRFPFAERNSPLSALGACGNKGDPSSRC